MGWEVGLIEVIAFIYFIGVLASRASVAVVLPWGCHGSAMGLARGSPPQGHALDLGYLSMVMLVAWTVASPLWFLHDWVFRKMGTYKSSFRLAIYSNGTPILRTPHLRAPNWSTGGYPSNRLSGYAVDYSLHMVAWEHWIHGFANTEDGRSKQMLVMCRLSKCCISKSILGRPKLVYQEKGMKHA